MLFSLVFASVVLLWLLNNLNHLVGWDDDDDE